MTSFGSEHDGAAEESDRVADDQATFAPVGEQQWVSRRTAIGRALVTLAATALFGLLALAASRAAPRRVDSKGDGVLVTNLVAAFAVVVSAVSIVLLLASLFLRGRANGRDQPGHRSGVRIVAAVVLVLMLLMLFLRRLKRHDAVARQSAAVKPTTHAPPPSAVSMRPTWGLGLGIGILVIAVLVFVVVAVVARRRRPAGGGPERDFDADAALAVGDVVREVEDEPDPRRAVIRAYDGMERVFASFGMSPAPADTPAEFLSRTLGRTGLSPGPMALLTQLYVSARFDVRAVDESMRHRSIDALRRVRGEFEDRAVPIGSL